MLPVSTSLPTRLKRLIADNFGTSRGAIRLLLAHTEYVTGRLDDLLSSDLSSVHRLVFVCLGNINRSAFGEAVATSLGIQSASIGLSTTTGAPAYEKAIQTAPHFGLDLAAHTATDLSHYQYREGDLLLVMEVRHAHKLITHGIPARSIVLLGQWASPRRLHIHDPHTLSDNYFRTCFTIIQSAVRALHDELRQASSPCISS